MAELFATDAWIALMEFVGIGGTIAGVGCYIEWRTERRGKNDKM